MEWYAKQYQYLDEMVQLSSHTQDHVSQKRAAQYFDVITYGFAVDGLLMTQIIGFLLGMYTQKFKITAMFVFAAMILNLVLFLPGYPCYKKNKLNFLPAYNKKHE